VNQESFILTERKENEIIECSHSVLFTLGFSSRICWRISLCFSTSFSCRLLCASSNYKEIGGKKGDFQEKKSKTFVHFHTITKVFQL
jgi:hypothetical protein